jgi:polysaccharide export outer membrane protein
MHGRGGETGDPGDLMRNAFVCCLLLGVCGCESFPHDGPSATTIVRGAAVRSGQERYGLVDLDYRVAQIVAEAQPAPLAGLAGATSNAPNDRLAPGDVVSIAVFEPGSASLFSDRTGSDSVTSPAALQHIVVDGDGRIALPYAGSVRVAGLTPAAAAAEIRSALRGKVFDPQVILTLVSSPANSVSVIGEVRNAGRFPLSANNDRLMDALASAGGPTKPPADVLVTVVRGSNSVSAPLSVLMRDADQNLRLAPGDQIRLLYQPRKYSTFGALTRDQQLTIEDDRLTLAAAVSRAGGLDTNSADASSVLLFRFERPQIASLLGVDLPATIKGVPIVYRLNLRDPAGYLISNSFEVQADDLIYVPRSDVTETKKFLDLVTAISQVTYNVRVTSVLN